MKRMLSVFLTSHVLLLTSSAWAQGPLAPPGAPAPMMKTLEQIEPRTPIESLPFTIGSPGSYFFTRDLAAPGPDGIVIDSSDVALDMKGFELVGGMGDGIWVMGGHTNVLIRDGTVRDWDERGIRADFAHGIVIERVTARDNDGEGIAVGDDSTVRDCMAMANGSNGIRTGQRGAVLRCTAAGNGTSGFGSGIMVNPSSLVRDSTAWDNADDGISAPGPSCVILNVTAVLNGGAGVNAQMASTIADSIAQGNTGAGFIIGETGMIRDSIALGNLAGPGIHGFFGNSVKRCLSVSNLDGIVLGGSGTIIDCTVAFNTEAGISLADSGSVIDCTVNNNNQGGITGSSGNTIRGCTLNNNQPHGIWVDSRSLVVDNLVNVSTGLSPDDPDTTGAGIVAAGVQNRIEGNHVTESEGIGVSVRSVANVIVRNSAVDNDTNYDMVAGNRYGPIVDLTPAGGVAAPDMSGDSAPSTLGGDDPMANYAM